MTLAKVVTLTFFFLVLLLLALDDQAAVGQFDLDIFLIHARDFSGDFVALVFLGDVHGGRAMLEPRLKSSNRWSTCCRSFSSGRQKSDVTGGWSDLCSVVTGIFLTELLISRYSFSG